MGEGEGKVMHIKLCTVSETVMKFIQGKRREGGEEEGSGESNTLAIYYIARG